MNGDWQGRDKLPVNLEVLLFYLSAVVSDNEAIGRDMKQSTERFLTTHVGSLARPPGLLELMFARERGQDYDPDAFKENVIGGSDCGFSSFANTEPEIHPTIVWTKFQSLAEGARLASRELW